MNLKRISDSRSYIIDPTNDNDVAKVCQLMALSDTDADRFQKALRSFSNSNKVTISYNSEETEGAVPVENGFISIE